MPIPVDYQTGLITGKWVDLNGTPVVGSVTFSVSANRIVDTAYNTVIVPAVRSVVLDMAGTISIALPATDDPDVQPTGFTYQVVESFRDGGGLTYNIAVPKNVTTDLSSVIAVTASGGTVTGQTPSGPTSARPSASTVGGRYFDTTLGIPIWSTGAVWHNALGANV